MPRRHKVFISYHHKRDENYKRIFEKLFGKSYISKSVEIGYINPNLKTETIRQKIRDEYLRESTVTVVLVGSETWKRKHVDWEISSSIRHTQLNPRSGLLGIILPTHPNYRTNTYNQYIIPPRLIDNIKCGYAKINKWTQNNYNIQNWIHTAFLRKNRVLPENSRLMFKNNRSGLRWY
ncbi:hypothetical protein LCGC14_0818870 [marine sediment metagenome]|uniref:Thoeris protein ThsB TIR-like domain-containing protein n=1 Tax=marine sediment metagenome TaxID=412755 RepID=A0A0F9SRZ0_9ZZZZ